MVPIYKRPTWVIASGAALAVTAAGVTGIALAGSNGSNERLPGPINLQDRVPVGDTGDDGARPFDVVPNPIVTDTSDSPFDDMRFNASISGDSQDSQNGPVGAFDATGDSDWQSGPSISDSPSIAPGGAALDTDSYDSPAQQAPPQAPVGSDDSASFDSPDSVSVDSPDDSVSFDSPDGSD